MIQRIIPMAMAPSVPGLLGIHFQALAAVLEKRGSITAYFSRPETSPSVILVTRSGGP